MRTCDKCGTRNDNTILNCRNCAQPIVSSDNEVKSNPSPDGEYQKQVIEALNSLNYKLSKISGDRDSSVNINAVSMSIKDMAIFILKWTVASLPTVLLVAVASIWVLGFIQ